MNLQQQPVHPLRYIMPWAIWSIFLLISGIAGGIFFGARVVIVQCDPNPAAHSNATPASAQAPTLKQSIAR